RRTPRRTSSASCRGATRRHRNLKLFRTGERHMTKSTPTTDRILHHVALGSNRAVMKTPGTKQLGGSYVLEHWIGQDWRSVLCALGTAALHCRTRRLSARTVYPAYVRARPAGATGFLSCLVCDRGHRPCHAELAQQSSGFLVQRGS